MADSSPDMAGPQFGVPSPRLSRGCVDNDPNFWHGREAASVHVRRHSATTEETRAGSGGANQGTIMGVVFPCMANILGVLLFLRLPWIVGLAGIVHGFCLVLICCCCTFVTTLSLSAVATNGKILGGGAYFLISRSLGPALGAGVGLCFYMANSIGAAMYFMGTVEAWEIANPDMQLLAAGETNNIRVTGFCILAVALIIVGGGIKYVARLGTVFLFIVLLVILCMYVGCFVGPGDDKHFSMEVSTDDGTTSKISLEWFGISRTAWSDNFGSAYNSKQFAFPADQTEHSFISLMALWFPAVTGIMAGSNRSSDLANPANSIPKGTLFAQGLTSVVYLSFVLLYGAVAPRDTLLHDKFFAATSAWPMKECVMYGVMASTIGAGLTSLVSGTRLLSAIAQDKTLPILGVFAARPGREPRLALLASGVLCSCAVAIGELNAVAPVLTMFFLMCYTCVNMSCTILHAVDDPNWRPRFRFHHWSISLLGAILCVWMMFAISPIYAMVAIIFCSAIFSYATHNSHQVKWGDGFQGIKFQLARNILTRMDIQAHKKNWRPQLLVVTEASITQVDQTGAGDAGKAEGKEVITLRDPELLPLASQLKGGRGITIFGGVCGTKGADVFSDGGLFVCRDQRQKVLDGQEAMLALLRRYSIEGFGRVVYTDNFSDGVLSLVQISGLGAFQPNCVVSTWPREWDAPGKVGHQTRAQLIRLVQVAVVFQKVVLLSKGLEFPPLGERLVGTIDIWWIVADGGILLLLPFLLSKHSCWQKCRTRLFAVAEEVGDDPDMVKEELTQYIRDFRLNIEVHVKILTDQALYSTDVISKARDVNLLFGDDSVPPERPDGVEPMPSTKVSSSIAAPGVSPKDGATTSSAVTVSPADGPVPILSPKEPDDLPVRSHSPGSVQSSLSRWRNANPAQPAAGSSQGFPAHVPGAPEPVDEQQPARNSASSGGENKLGIGDAAELGGANKLGIGGSIAEEAPDTTLGLDEPVRQISRHSDDLPTRQISATSIGSGLAKWREAHGGAEGRYHPVTGSRLHPSKAPFPDTPPSSIGRQAQPGTGVDKVCFDSQKAVQNTVDSSHLDKNALSSASKDSKDSGSSDRLGGHAGTQSSFMHSAEQLHSDKPCSEEELNLALALNHFMREESKDAQLVVTNLPDMPPGESAYGYFQLIDAMTRDLKRCFLVRGTATEVITAFT